MTATILQFPKRDTSEQLAQVGKLMKTAVPVPHAANAGLDMLLQIGGKLLDNLNDYTRPGCSDMLDGWLARVEGLDAKNAG